MNSEDNNSRQIKKLERMERIYSDEKKHDSVPEKMTEREEDICAPARRIFCWAFLIVWLACGFTLFSGGDFSITAAAVLFVSGIYSGLCVTKFINEKKKGDAAVAVIIAIATVALGIALLAGNTQY